MEKDFLDILRYLNKENINKFSEKEHFFNSLMACDDNVPDYFENLSNAYYIEFDKQFSNSAVKNYMLSNLFGNEIKNKLSYNSIEDKKNCLYIGLHSAAHALTYVGSIKGMRELLATSSEHFNFFKQSILQGLIARYCYNIVSGQNKDSERLNKLIVIYAEHIRNIEPSKEIPIIIDENFISDLFACKNKNNGILDLKDCYNTVHNLINKKFPINYEEFSSYVK